MIAASQIDRYLVALRGQLGPMTLAEREEIVMEIGAHIRDSAEQTGASPEAILDRLGSPAELAAQYRDGLLIRQASHSISPLRLMRGALRLATKGVFGIAVFFVGLFGYILGGGLALSGMIKPILPANTGVWVRDGRLISSGTLFPPPAAPAHEILGMWYIVIALTLGSLTLLLTSFLIRAALRLSQRWQSKLLPHATA